jgi:hypothetical protein
MHPKLRAIRRYNPAVLIELCRLWLILFYVDVRLELLPPRWNREFLFRKERDGAATPGPRTLAKLSKIVILLRTAARFRLRSGSPCLCLSLALRERLAPLGLRASIVYGARKRSDRSKGIDAHAWLVLGEATLDPGGDAISFTAFSKGLTVLFLCRSLVHLYR